MEIMITRHQQCKTAVHLVMTGIDEQFLNDSSNHLSESIEVIELSKLKEEIMFLQLMFNRIVFDLDQAVLWCSSQIQELLSLWLCHSVYINCLHTIAADAVPFTLQLNTLFIIELKKIKNVLIAISRRRQQVVYLKEWRKNGTCM